MYKGILAAGEEDIELALSRRDEAKSTRRDAGAIKVKNSNELAVLRVAGCSARVLIATSFLEHIGFPLDAFGGGICTSLLSRILTRFMAGLWVDTEMLLDVTKKGLGELATEWYSVHVEVYFESTYGQGNC